jgi:hypothetical protein
MGPNIPATRYLKDPSSRVIRMVVEHRRHRQRAATAAPKRS